jgi:small conductance mechanosensitive channel
MSLSGDGPHSIWHAGDAPRGYDSRVIPDQVSVDRLLQIGEEYLIPFAINLVMAAIVFVIGRWGARLATRVLSRLLRRAHTDESLVKFITDMAYALLLAVVVIAALERLGVKTTAAVAIIGAAGLAVGLALQGSLGNFAAGVMIMVFRPYRVGDTVVVAGKTGTVESVHIFNTVLHSSDMRKIIVPNGAITSTSIENLSALGTRRLEFQIVVQCGGDLEGAKTGLRRAVDEVPAVMAEPVPEVSVVELAEGKATFMVHASVKTEEFGAASAELMERVKGQFADKLVAAKAA